MCPEGFLTVVTRQRVHEADNTIMILLYCDVLWHQARLFFWIENTGSSVIMIVKKTPPGALIFVAFEAKH